MENTPYIARLQITLDDGTIFASKSGTFISDEDELSTFGDDFENRIKDDNTFGLLCSDGVYRIFNLRYIKAFEFFLVENVMANPALNEEV